MTHGKIAHGPAWQCASHRRTLHSTQPAVSPVTLSPRLAREQRLSLRRHGGRCLPFGYPRPNVLFLVGKNLVAHIVRVSECERVTSKSLTLTHECPQNALYALVLI